MAEITGGPTRRVWADAVKSLELYVKKQLANRRAWGIFAKVIPPPAPLRPYSVILERGGVTEKFFLKDHEVARFAATGNDASVSTDIRTALQHLDKRTRGRSITRWG